MSTASAPAEPDRLANAPHPRETLALYGQEAAEAAFLGALAGDRLHHGWLITGPLGVGKATLAWRIARALRAAPPAGGLLGDAAALPQTLDIAPDHPVARRMAAGAEPGVFCLRRAWDDKRKRLKASIGVDDVRPLGAFFGLSAADGGRRVVIVDSADEMTPQAANALLKLLEEPPENAVLLLISHRPSGLLPTIRSRCRMLRLAALGPAALQAALDAAGHAPTGGAAEAEALAALSHGSAGEAIRLAGAGGPALYARLLALFDTPGGLDRAGAMALAQSLAGAEATERREIVWRLLEIALARLARTGATGAPPTPEAAPGEAALLARRAPGPAAARAWAEAAATHLPRARRAAALSLDPAALLLDTLSAIAADIGRAAAKEGS